MTITYDPTYHGNPILTNKEKKLGCDTRILDKIESVMDHATQKHNKVLAFRMDLSYPQNHHAPQDNQDISKFMSKFIKQHKRQGIDMDYVWVREQSKEKHHHYHAAIFCDGNKKQHPQKLLQQAEKHWGQTVGVPGQGLVDHCTRSRSGQSQPNAYMLRRNDKSFDQTKADCF